MSRSGAKFTVGQGEVGRVAALTRLVRWLEGTPIFDALRLRGMRVDEAGNVEVDGTVDGRDVATDGTKLDGIEAGADVTEPAGSNKEVQFNDGGVLGAEAGFEYDKATNTLAVENASLSGNIAVDGTVDGRDVAADGTKLDGVEALADVTDATNVNAAGAVMETDEFGWSVTFGDGSTAIATGVAGWVEIPFGMTLTEVRLFVQPSGSIKVDVWVDSYANFPPDNGDTITGGNEPEVSSGVKDEDTTLTSWTKGLSEGDVMMFNVDSCSTVTRVTIAFRAVRA